MCTLDRYPSFDIHHPLLEMKSAKSVAFVILLLLLLSRPGICANAQAWVGSWAASQQIPEPGNSLAPGDLHDATVRQIVRSSIGGSKLRVHISNAFGTEPLRFTSVHIARPLSPAASAIDPKSDKPLTFSGATEVIVPAGAEYISDSIDYPVAPLSSMAITFHMNEPPGSRDWSSWIARHVLLCAGRPCLIR